MKDREVLHVIIGAEGSAALVAHAKDDRKRYVVRGNPMTRETAVSLAVATLDMLMTDEERKSVAATIEATCQEKGDN